MITTLKFLLAPLLIALMSLVGQRFGHRAAGLLAGFPFVAGPIFIVFVAEQGAAFGQEAGFAALNGVLCLAAFCLVYAWISQRCNWMASLVLGWLSFAAAAGVMTLLPQAPLLAFAVALVVPVFGPYCFPRLKQPAPRAPLGRGELPTRMVAALALVLSLTGVAAATGPVLAGVLTPFPVASSVLAVFSHRRNGPQAAVEALRGVISGMYSFISFFAVAAWTLPLLGGAQAIACGIAVALLVQALLFGLGPRNTIKS